MILPDQNLITTRDLATELGVHRVTVSRWARGRLRKAVFARGLFSIQTLREMRVLTTPVPTDQPETIACPS